MYAIEDLLGVYCKNQAIRQLILVLIAKCKRISWKIKESKTSFKLSKQNIWSHCSNVVNHHSIFKSKLLK